MKLLDTPCKCGWKFSGFHVCVDLSKPCVQEKQAPKIVDNRSLAMTERWERHHAANAERNDAMIAKYNDGHSFAQIAEMFNLPTHTVSRIMHRAAKAGDTIVRPRGGIKQDVTGGNDGIAEERSQTVS